MMWNAPWAYGPRAAKPSPLDNPAFRFWFGNSVIVNADGTPRIVYHGTNVPGAGQNPPPWIARWYTETEQHLVPDSTFTVFEPGKEDIGIHFGTKEQADDLVVSRAGVHVEGRIYPVYIRLENPIRMMDTSEWFPFGVAERLGDAPGKTGRPPILTSKEVERVVHTTDTRGHSQARKVLVSILKAHGYDGVVYQNLYEGNKKDDSYIVFDPNQIKSAYGNRGTFDPRDPDILHGWKYR